MADNIPVATVTRPATKRVAAQPSAGTTTPLSLEGLAGGVSLLGDALDKHLESKEIQANKDAVIRQGQETGLVEFYKHDQNTGLSKMLYGANPGKDKATEIAAQNKAMLVATEEMANIQKNVATTPKDYHSRLNGILEQQMESFEEGDDVSRLAFTNAWNKLTPKLAHQQSASHATYNEVNASNASIQAVAAEFSGHSEVLLSGTTELKEESMEGLRAMFSPGWKLSGATDAATVNHKSAGLTTAINNGSILPYKVAVDEGFVEGLPADQAKRLKAAVTNYDTRQGQEMSALVYETKGNALESGDIREYTRGLSLLEAHEAKLSGTPESKRSYEAARLSLLQAKDSVERQHSKQTTKLIRADQLLKLQLTGTMSNQIAAGNYTKEEQETAVDLYALQLGNPDALASGQVDIANVGLAYDQIMNDPQSLQKIGRYMRDTGQTTNSMISAVQLMAQRELMQEGESGFLSERSVTTSKNLAILREAMGPAYFRQQMGNELDTTLAVIERNQHRPASIIQDRINTALNPDTEVEVPKSLYPDIKTNESKPEWLVRKLGLGDASPSTAAYYYGEFEQGMRIYNNDVPSALKYANEARQTYNDSYAGHIIEGSKNQFEDLPKVLSNIDGTSAMTDLLEQHLGPRIFQQDGLKVNSLSQLGIYKMYWHPSFDSLIIEANELMEPLVITSDYLNGVSDLVDEWETDMNDLRAEQVRATMFKDNGAGTQKARRGRERGTVASSRPRVEIPFGDWLEERSR